MAKEKTYEELDFTDDFLFCKILETNEELCKSLLELIIGKKISRIVYKHNQESIKITSDGKGIRLDVYVQDDTDTVYDIEMQTTPDKNIAKRSRYYQGMIDLSLLESGDHYSRLKQSYIIFICLSNPFSGKPLHSYFFENTCEGHPEILLDDKAYKIIVTPDSSADDVGKEMEAFLEYLVKKIPTSELTRQIEGEVSQAKLQEKWRTEYMTLLMRDQEKREEGRAEGRIESIKMMLTSNLEKSVILGCGFTEEEFEEALNALKCKKEE